MTAAELRADPTVVAWLLLPLPLDDLAEMGRLLERVWPDAHVGPSVDVDGVGTVLPIRILAIDAS